MIECYHNAKIFSNVRIENAVQQIQETAKKYPNSAIRVMPDYHVGSECTIGLTMKTTTPVSPRLVGVDIGCFSGDTKVKLTDGKDLSFLELIEEEKKGIEHFGYSLDKNGHVQVSKLELPRKIKTVPYTFIITLDNGEKIRCTDDHIFYKRNLEEVEAKDLKVGDSLYPLYLKKRNELLNEKFLSVNGLLDENDDHLCVYDVVDNGYKYVHWLSDDYNFRHNQTRIVHKFVRHHLDFDKFNNDPTNIERVSFKDHFKIHADNVGYLSKIGKMGYKRVVEKYGEEKAKEFCSIAGKKRAYSTWHGEKADELRKKNGEHLASWNKSDVAREKARQRQLTNNTTKFSEQNKQEWFINRQKIAKIKKYLDYMVENNLEITEENWELVRPNFYRCYYWDNMNSILNEVHLTYQDVLDGKVNKNHYIKSIEKIDEEIDVYCLTCFEFSNFALSSGVFVHNCGVLSFKIKEHLDLQPLDDFIHKNIPVGFNVGEPNEKVLEFLHGLRCFEHLTKVERLSAGVGSLGSGNHFIEVEQDEEGYQYLTVHTGSRNLGIQVSEYYSKLFDNQEPFWDDYINDLKMTQYYAERNRQKILFDICIGLNLSILDIIESVHNYFDGLFVRKGAIDASKGKRVIIPMNMRDGVILGTGLGNEEWNFSAPHGAGRILSRKQAKTQVKLEDFQKSMEGIYTTTCNQNTIDEACFAYKPIQEILDVIGETITVDKVIKPIYNFKGF